ncbi:hypothetical protein [Burkholderia sp. JP2-270]|uniref:hypothetical protein n=1 Tax=Burkholderia sp. JP2-270 TaxID=2217913 RepID=UPI0013A6A2A6|nr:hypothetical protein [Burkholderia sp. JP2-270]
MPGVLPFRDQSSALKPISGLELCVTRPQATLDKTEVLQFLLCTVWRPTIVMGDQRNLRPMVDTELVFLPYYIRPPLRNPMNLTWGGFLNRSNLPGARTPGGPGGVVPHVQKSFISVNHTLCRTFRVSEWPVVRPDLTAVIGDAFDTFCAYLLTGATTLGN